MPTPPTRYLIVVDPDGREWLARETDRAPERLICRDETDEAVWDAECAVRVGVRT